MALRVNNIRVQRRQGLDQRNKKPKYARRFSVSRTPAAHSFILPSAACCQEPARVRDPAFPDGQRLLHSLCGGVPGAKVYTGAGTRRQAARGLQLRAREHWSRIGPAAGVRHPRRRSGIQRQAQLAPCSVFEKCGKGGRVRPQGGPGRTHQTSIQQPGAVSGSGAAQSFVRGRRRDPTGDGDSGAQRAGPVGDHPPSPGDVRGAAGEAGSGRCQSITARQVSRGCGCSVRHCLAITARLLLAPSIDLAGATREQAHPQPPTLNPKP